MLNLMDSEKEIGQELSEVIVAEKVSALTFKHPCPNCSSGLRIIRSRASGKRFIGCTGWSNGCKFTLPLPQYGSLKIIDKNCKICGFQMVEARTGRRRPLVSCPKCYKNSREAVQNTSSQKVVAV
jgi:DNA topoisomerase-1